MKEKQVLPHQIASGRMTLLVMIVLTFLNIILYYMNSAISFPYSAFTPYFAVILGDLLATSIGSSSVIIVFYLVALCCFAIYIIGWFASRKKFGWFIGLTIFYILDTAFMVYTLFGNSIVDMLIDIALHGVIIYSFVMAAVFYIKEKKRLNTFSDTIEVIDEVSDEK